MEFVLDERTIRLLTHLPATAMVQCDLVWLDHSPVVQSPRTILQTPARPVRRAAAGTRWPAPSWSSSPSTRPTRRPPTRRYRDLTPVNQYNVDYSILGTTRVEPLLRAIRNTMYDAGLDVEGAKGECNFGQHEIGFLYADALTTADNHSVYKTVAKEIAAQQGKSITFMAKYNEREGSSCHIHLSLRGTDGGAGVLGRRRRTSGRRSTTTSWPGCWPRSADFTLLYAPNINSYKRFAAGSFAPTAIAWGLDNRTCAVRLVGPRRGRPDGEPGPRRGREPLPRPGRDAGRRAARHRAGAAARGRAGRQRLRLRQAAGAAHHGARRASGSPSSALARAAFGDEVVDHYTNMADVELAAYGAAVTDWELRRGFERL